MKKRNINRLLENSRRNEVRGYNIYASAKKWEDYKKLTNAMISENLDFFRNLPEGYSETVK